jgi:O-antigen/teichoic acid export membrane protein
MHSIRSFLFKNTSVRQTVLKNTFWLFVSETVGRILKMGLVIYAARMLGADGWGVFSYALSLGSLLMIFSDIGLGNLITREAIQKKDNYSSFISTALLLKGIVLAASTLLIVLLSPSISHLPEARVLFPMIALVLFFDSLRDLGLAINKVFEKMEREMVVKALMNVVVLALGIVLLHVYLEPQSVAIAYAVGSAIGFVLIAILMRKDIRGLISTIDMRIIPSVIKTAWPFALIALITTVMANTDIYMLGIWKDPTEIGLYASVQRIQQFILILPIMIATAVFPLFSRLANKDNMQFSIALEKTMAITMMIGIPIAFGGLILSEEIVTLFFGVGYANAVPILNILMVMLLVSFPLILLSNAIFAYNEQKHLALAYLSGVIANVLLNILLIPQYGAVGSAIATFVCSAVITLIIWIKMKSINSFRTFRYVKKSILATIGMLCILALCQYFDLHIVITALGSMIFYVVVLLLLKEPLLKEIQSILRPSAETQNS